MKTIKIKKESKKFEKEKKATKTNDQKLRKAILRQRRERERK